MKIKILFALLIIASNALAQTDIKELFCVDTILKAKNILLQDTRFGNTVFDESEGQVVFNLSSDDKHETPVGIYHKTTHQYQEINLHIPKTITIDEKSSIKNIRLTKEYIVVFYHDFYFTFDINKEHTKAMFKSITYLNNDFENYFVTPDNYIICSLVYNRSIGEKVQIAKYKLFETEPVRHIEPAFDCIALSHFSPNHWVDVNEDYIAFTQACNYQTTIYNHDLKVVTTLNRNIPEWKPLNADTAKLFSDKTPSEIFKTLGPVNTNKISKVEGVWWLNKNTLMLRYYLSNVKEAPLPDHYWDIYHIENTKATLLDSNIKDGGIRLAINDTTTKCNYYLLSWTTECFIKNNTFITIKPTAPIPYFNRRLGDIFEEQNKYMKAKAPFSGIWIYEWNTKKVK